MMMMMMCCVMAVKKMGMLGVSVRKMKALTVKVETVTLIGGNDRWNLTCFVYYMHEINGKMLILSIRFIYLGVVLD
jgi:hypothetical protein